MRQRIELICLGIFLWFCHAGLAQTDYFGISSIKMDGEKYKLKWSANVHHGERYIEELLPHGETYPRYGTKIIIDYMKNGKSLESLFESKIVELTDQKEEGRVFSFQEITSKNSEEKIVEFVTGDVRDGKTLIAEWNLFRYKPNKEGCIIFGISKRIYEEKNVNKFLQKMKENRENWIKEIEEYSLPIISIREQ